MCFRSTDATTKRQEDGFILVKFGGTYYVIRHVDSMFKKNSIAFVASQTPALLDTLFCSFGLLRASFRPWRRAEPSS